MVQLEADAGLRQLVREHAESASGAAAILSATGESVSYAQLEAHIRAYGAVLRQAGIGPRDQVAIVGAGAELAIAVLGVVSHAAAAPLDPRSSSAELRALLSGLEPRLIFAQQAVSTPVYEVAKELGIET